MLAGVRRGTAGEYAVVSGCLLAALTAALRHLVFAPYGLSALHVLVELWVLVGAFALAAIPTYVLVRHRTLLPVVITLGLYSYVALATHLSVRYTERAATGPNGAPLLLELYVWIWFVPLGVGLLVGAGEYLVQHLFQSRAVVADSNSRS